MGHVRDVVTDFSENTTAHGFKNVLQCGNCSGKGVWIVAMLIAWIVCCIQLTQNIMDYLEYPTATTVAVQYSASLQFPAVTICNLNGARWLQMLNDSTLAAYTTRLKAARPQTNSWNNDASGSQNTDMGNQSAGMNRPGPGMPPNQNADLVNQSAGMNRPGPGMPPNQSARTSNENGIQPESLFKLVHLQTIYDRKLSMSTMGHQLDDMLLDCTFQGRQCAPKNFTKWQHGTYGNCYTMIIDKNQFPTYVGPAYGLALTLYAEEYQYCPLIAPAVGFRVELHSPSYVPFPEDLGFTISPGSLASMAMSQVVITRQPFPYNGLNCRKILQDQNNAKPNVYESWSNIMLQGGHQAGTNYTNQACKKSCYLLLLSNQCDCVDAGYVTFQQMNFTNSSSQIPHACDFSNDSVTDCVTTSTNAINAECDNVCDQPCYEEYYDTRITNSLWPREDYFLTMRNAWSQRNPNLANMTVQNASSQIMKLEVYLRVLNYEAITETPVMYLADLLTNIGGTLGLYGGFSFLTILEFFECFARMTVRKKQQSKKVSAVAQNNVSYQPEKAHYVA